MSKHLTCGLATAVVSRTITAPLERVKIEMQLYHSNVKAMDIIKSIYRKEGLPGFMRGLGTI